MKIRIKGNSIRFRLTKPEVDHFAKEGSLEEKTEFGATIFSYALKIKKECKNLSAEFSDGTITLFIPEGFAKKWTTTEKIGYKNEVEIGGGKKLFLLLEKDYKCMDPTLEDQEDNYENPLAVKKGRQ